MMKKTVCKRCTQMFRQLTGRALSIILMVAMALSLSAITPLTANAATYVYFLSIPTKSTYQVGEGFDTTGLHAVLHDNGKETDITDKITFITSKTVELTQGRPFQTVGKKVIELRYEGNQVGGYTVTVTEQAKSATDTPAVPATTSGWPFVPSDKNMTNGKVKSGWAYILSHDEGKFRVNSDNTVSPSRRFNEPFYFEHLGNDKYYIHAAYGGYLSYKGKIEQTAPIIISDEPCKWFLDAYNEGGVRKFALVTDANHKYVIRTWGFCTETMDSQITLHNTLSSGNAYMHDCKFTISDWVSEHTIPQWWFDYKDGKPAPTGKVEEPLEDGYGYYERLAFADETKLPATTTSISYNLELPDFNSSFPKWGSTVKNNLLSRNERGTYLWAEVDEEYVMIKKVSEAGKVLGTQYLKYELPIFGAVFSGREYNYIAFGQENREENDSRETIRIVKYDKEFNRISSVSVLGGSTKAINPITHTARFAENGNQLILHTTRSRYKSDDGLNHQSNLDIFVDTDTMKATYVSSLFPSNHVSHSFDTYVRFDDNHRVFLDLGDGSPRSVVLQKAAGSSCIKATMFAIPGPDGANYTGVTAGGLEVSESNYLTAIATIDQSAAKWERGNSNASLNSGMVPMNESSLTQRDIVVCILPRSFHDGATAKKVTIEKYTGTSKIASTPQLLKISNNKFAVLWAEFPLEGGKYVEGRGGNVVQAADNYIVQYIDENGNKTGDPIRYEKADDFYAEYRKSAKPVVKANHPFTDVSSGSYYETPVVWALNNRVTSGASATTFAPNETCTRGQVVTFLWRANGSPEPASNKNPFTDVKSADYFYKAVLWAVEKGITSGTSTTAFSPNDTCTSGQVVMFLWRSNGKPGASGVSSLAEKYSGQFYTDAVAWADGIGLLTGTGIAFAPNNNSPRADIVTYLYRNAGSPAMQ